MADTAQNNIARQQEIRTNYAELLYRDWRKSENPERILSHVIPDGISLVCDYNLNRRINSCNGCFEWTFSIACKGKQLRHVALAIPDTNNFLIKSVCNKKTREIGRKSNYEWHSLEEHITTNELNKNILTSKSPYIVTISFFGQNYRTYRQNIIFAFNEGPAVLRRLCVDCTTDADLQRIEKATEHQLTQNPIRWTEEMVAIRRFESVLVQLRDPKEESLSMIYLYPDKENYFLTQETLNDESLTRVNYRGRLHELIATEESARHEQIARYNEIAHMRILSHYIVQSAGDSATVAKYAYHGELFAQLPLSRHIVEETKSGRLFLRSCNTLLIRSLGIENLTTPMVFEAHIEDKCTQSVYLRLSKSCVDALNLIPDMDLQVQVQFILTRLTFCEWHRAVDNLSDVNLVFLNDKYREESRNDFFQELISTHERTYSNTADSKIVQVMLNSEQRRAVNLITMPTLIRLPPILLLGPFGTGKTFTIAQALRMLLKKDPEYKILLCTHSNSAADLYVREYFDIWYQMEKHPRFRPTRLYYKGRAKNTVHPIVQEYTLMDENGVFRDPTEEDLRYSRLIITTLATASALMNLNITPTHIVIDEAAQALECEILIPLSLATRDTRVVLAGDQMQLAPEIYSDLANECGMGISMLERLYKEYPKTHPCCVHLCASYRSDPEIIQFTSEMFYRGLVQPYDNRVFRHPTLKPLTFFAVTGEEVQGMHSTGYIHTSEACELANRVLEMRNTWPVDRWGPYTEGSIGVLSYYAEQVQRIRTELRKRGLYDVSVERVLNVQGKQFTVVFISIVRTRNGCRHTYETSIKDYGFLTNPRLLNTAITRAKRRVAVVGDPLGLLTIGSCRKMWQRYVEMASLYGTTHETLKYHLSLIPDLPPPTPLNPLAQEFVPRQQMRHIVEYVAVPMLCPVIHSNV